jgi:hypothetical protein
MGPEATNGLNPDTKICGVWGLLSSHGLCSSLSVSKIRSYILSLYHLSLSAPDFEKTLLIAIKQGGTAEAAINGDNETLS